jgi:hypothetical protein
MLDSNDVGFSEEGKVFEYQEEDEHFDGTLVGQHSEPNTIAMHFKIP